MSLLFSCIFIYSEDLMNSSANKRSSLAGPVVYQLINWGVHVRVHMLVYHAMLLDSSDDAF